MIMLKDSCFWSLFVTINLMAKKKKIDKSWKVAAALFFIGLALELTSVIVAFTIGHPYKNTCPAEFTIPEICLLLCVLSLLVTIAALATTSNIGRKNFILPASILLIILIVCLAWPIQIQAGWGISWCDVHW